MKLQNTQAGMHDLTTRKYQTKQYSELPTAKANQASKPKITTTLVRTELREHLGRRTRFTDRRRFRSPPSRGRAKDAAIVGREEITSLVCESIPLRSPQETLEPLLGG